MGKKGGFVNIETMVSSGLGAYAAKNATSMKDLLWTLAKYSLVVVAILFVIALVMMALGVSKEKFVPVMPSREQDQKIVTPAGNVITY